MEEIRSEHNQHVVHNPWDREERNTKTEEVRHFLGDTGGVQSHTINRQAACHCGCIKPAAGFCGSCQGIICVSCYSRCDGRGCSKPIGPCCSVLIEDESRRIIRLCKECYSASRRKRALTMVFRVFATLFLLIISPFVKIEK